MHIVEGVTRCLNANFHDIETMVDGVNRDMHRLEVVLVPLINHRDNSAEENDGVVSAVSSFAICAGHVTALLSIMKSKRIFLRCLLDTVAVCSSKASEISRTLYAMPGPSGGGDGNDVENGDL